MDQLGPILMIVLLLILAIFAAIYGSKQAQKRRDALAALAGKLGWRFDPSNHLGHDEQFGQFRIFRRGHGRRAYNTLTGQVQIAGRSYDGRMGDFLYKVTRSTGKSTSTRTYRFSYLLLRPPFPVPADLHIRPEGLFDKLAGAMGFDDIDFESDEFSRRYHVKSADKRFAYDVIHPRMIEFLLASSGFIIELERGWCCLSDGRTRWEPGAFEQNLAWLGRFFEHWPDFLLEQLEGGHAP